MTEKKSVKISEKGYGFLDRMADNRIKAGTGGRKVSYWELIEIIAKYFKLNNDRYLEMIKMEEKND